MLCNDVLSGPDTDAPSYERLAYTIEETAKLTKLGRTTIYSSIGAGQLMARKLGTRTLVLETDLWRFLQGLPSSCDGPPCRSAATLKAEATQHNRATAYTIPDVCSMTSIGRTTLFSAIKSGRLLARRCGSRTIIIELELLRFLNALPILARRVRPASGSVGSDSQLADSE
jgi:excisionase family DNA binding protein